MVVDLTVTSGKIFPLVAIIKSNVFAPTHTVKHLLLDLPLLDDGGLRHLLSQISIHEYDWTAMWSPLLQILLD